MFLPAPPPLCGCGPGCTTALYCAGDSVSCNEISEIICPITRRWVARGLLMVSPYPALPVHCIFDKNLIPGGGERRGGGLGHRQGYLGDCQTCSGFNPFNKKSLDLLINSNRGINAMQF